MLWFYGPCLSREGTCVEKVAHTFFNEVWSKSSSRFQKLNSYKSPKGLIKLAQARLAQSEKVWLDQARLTKSSTQSWSVRKKFKEVRFAKRSQNKLGSSPKKNLEKARLDLQKSSKRLGSTRKIQCSLQKKLDSFWFTLTEPSKVGSTEHLPHLGLQPIKNLWLHACTAPETSQPAVTQLVVLPLLWNFHHKNNFVNRRRSRSLEAALKFCSACVCTLPFRDGVSDELIR